MNRNNNLREIIIFLFVLAAAETYGQAKDSARLPEVVVQAYFHERPFLRIPSSATVIDSSVLASQSGQTLVSAMNTSAGVRMEERSPGSYRLSIRGSLLRSPFGIRNVKIYLDDFPLTDAGGNTYLNIIDPVAVTRIEILKGPDGSLFGANSGGVVRFGLAEAEAQHTAAKAGINAGSFGMWHQYAHISYKRSNNILGITEGMQHADGYRENSRMDRQYYQLYDRLNYSERSRLSLLCFYSEIWYQTPGGLTLQEYGSAPSAARPSTATFEGAAAQHAGVHNQVFYAGIQHETRLLRNAKIMTLLFGTHTNFENPFITNYEVREELSGGARAWIETGAEQGRMKWKWSSGIEAQRTNSQITNYDNHHGERDTLRADNFLEASQLFVFTDLSLDLGNRLQADASASYNFNGYNYRDRLDSRPFIRNSFAPQLMPRFAVSWIADRMLVLRAVVSKGYSPPTLPEILSSGNNFNGALQPESGWNYEAGLRFRDHRQIFWFDLSVFYYRLDHAIVRRVDLAGEEYFVNSGGTAQPGMESELVADIIKPRGKSVFRALQLRLSYTFSMFNFRQYRIEANDYSGNILTGVPKHILASSLRAELPRKFSLYIQHSYVSEIFLNDANTVSSPAYQLLMVKFTWTSRNAGDFLLQANAGIDNIMDAHYSLGNDLNAAGGRYYNAAPPRNIFVGLSIAWK